MHQHHIAITLLTCAALIGCTSEGDNADTPTANTAAQDIGATADSDLGTSEPDAGPIAEAPALELRADLCDDSSKVAPLLEALRRGDLGRGGARLGETNTDLIASMLAEPTKGPFYMVNLIRYREKADYADGRQTDLSGREANALYAPVEFLTAIGARVVFSSEVGDQIDGEDISWESVAIVEYPCPLAFFAMSLDPDFQTRAEHKDAGVETTIVMVTDLAPSPLPPEFVPQPGPYPASEADPAFELIHVKRYHEQAQYEDGADEPPRTGEEAWDLYEASGAEASERIGIYPTATFVVRGVLIGDGRVWDEVQIVRQPSMAGFEALLDDAARQAGRYHRLAALADNYSLITSPQLNDIPGAPGAGGMMAGLPVTANGTGTACADDDSCPGDGVDLCLKAGAASMGFCTVEGCGAGECEGSYVCCRECAPAAAAMLPFEGSACVPGEAAAQLANAPIACTCD